MSTTLAPGATRDGDAAGVLYRDADVVTMDAARPHASALATRVAALRRRVPRGVLRELGAQTS